MYARLSCCSSSSLLLYQRNAPPHFYHFHVVFLTHSCGTDLYLTGGMSLEACREKHEPWLRGWYNWSQQTCCLVICCCVGKLCTTNRNEKLFGPTTTCLDRACSHIRSPFVQVICPREQVGSPESKFPDRLPALHTFFILYFNIMPDSLHNFFSDQESSRSSPSP